MTSVIDLRRKEFRIFVTEYFSRKVIRASYSKEHLHTWVKEFGVVEAAAAFVDDDASVLSRRTKESIVALFILFSFIKEIGSDRKNK